MESSETPKIDAPRTNETSPEHALGVVGATRKDGDEHVAVQTRLEVAPKAMHGGTLLATEACPLTHAEALVVDVVRPVGIRVSELEALLRVCELHHCGGFVGACG